MSAYPFRRLCRGGRFSETLSMFERVGSHPGGPSMIHWDRLPTPGSRLNAEPRHLPDEELLVSDFDVVLRTKY